MNSLTHKYQMLLTYDCCFYYLLECEDRILLNICLLWVQAAAEAAAGKIDHGGWESILR